MVIAAAKHYFDSHLEIISATPFLLPIATPFLLLGYRRLANKVDHWNYYANFFCVITIFGNALTFLAYPNEFTAFNASLLTSLGIPASFGEMVLTIFSSVSIFFALLTAFSVTRRLGLFSLITIGAISCVYRVLTLWFNSNPEMSFHLIIADFTLYSSYWLIPLMILLSLASRRKTQTLTLTLKH